MGRKAESKASSKQEALKLSGWKQLRQILEVSTSYLLRACTDTVSPSKRTAEEKNPGSTCRSSSLSKYMSYRNKYVGK